MTTATVRALVVHGAGDVRLEERPAPVPGPGEVAVRVAYGGIDGSDLHYWRHVRYLGSAAHLPHVQGGLTDVLGARVLVTGAGPIGLLVVAALRRAGAAEIVVTDVAPEPLERAAAVGAHRTAVVGTAPDPEAEQDEDPFAGLDADVAIESSGSPAGLATCLRGARRQGRVVVLGLLPPGDVPFPGNLVVTRELELVGTFRFDGEIHDVLQAFADGSLPAAPVVTHVLPLADAAGALELAGDPRRSGKVLLDLTGGAAAGTTP